MPSSLAPPLASRAQVVIYMKKYVDFFANLCQQDYQFQRYRPSHIAAAAILAARRALCIMWVPSVLAVCPVSRQGPVALAGSGRRVCCEF